MYVRGSNKIEIEPRTGHQDDEKLVLRKFHFKFTFSSRKSVGGLKASDTAHRMNILPEDNITFGCLVAYLASETSL